jgi:membrane fusion protein, heavy metal efflux system
MTHSPFRSLGAALLALVVLPACDAPPAQPQPATPRQVEVGDPADWCLGHGLPESRCTVCNPELTEGFVASGDWCPEHGYPESACPTCNPWAPPNSDDVVQPGTRIRFRSPEIEARAGIETAPAAVAGLGIGVDATARIVFDADRVAEIRSPTSGVVREVRAHLGDAIAPGRALIVLDSAEVGDLRARLSAARERSRTAEADLARQRDLRAAGIASSRQEELATQEVEAASSQVRAAEAALRAAGAEGEGASGRYAAVSPIAGILVRRPVVLGAAVSSADLLAMVADTSAVWALLDVQEEDIGQVQLGQTVSVEVDGVGARIFQGTIGWIAAEVDPRTRTVTARAELDNAEGLLLANQFGRATIQVAPAARVVAVPTAAVQRLDDGAVVFVRTGPGLYEPRAVDTGRSTAQRIEVKGLIEPGDAVVTTGAFLLKTELRKDAIGAGCCEVEAPGE